MKKSKSAAACERYFVPDLSPLDRPDVKGFKPRFLFVAESPHVAEVEPELMAARRPLCGAAGKKWWKMLGEILDGQSSEEVSLDRLSGLCRKHQLAVINAVQVPMDPKISKHYPGCDPVEVLGFAKVSGAAGYKKCKNGAEMREAIAKLRKRLVDPTVAQARIFPLGGDAEWFVKQALSAEEFESRVGEKIPHPSAWWRRGGLFGRVASEKLKMILS